MHPISHQALMAGSVIAAGGLAWLLTLAGYITATARQPRPAPAPEPPASRERPALLNLVVTGRRLDGEAYAATILDLAARGYLAAADREAGRLWISVPGTAGPSPDLSPFEQIVLDRVKSLAGAAGAPLEALTEACSEDVKGVWNPFDQAVRAEARGRLTQPRLSKGAQTVLYGGAATLAALIVAVQLHPPVHLSQIASEGVVSFIVLGLWVHSIAVQDRLTPSGAALARDAAALRAAGGPESGQPGEPGLSPQGGNLSDPVSLRRVAVMMGLDIPVPVPGGRPGGVAGVRPGGHRSAPVSAGRTPRPQAAWSSFGGQWRQVRIAAPKVPRVQRPLMMLFFAVGLAWVTFPNVAPGLLLKFPSVVVLAVMAVFGLLGLAGLLRWLARPGHTNFDAQVIAKWTEDHGRYASNNLGTNYEQQWIALDNGRRGWPLQVSCASWNSLALGDLVQASVDRSGHLRRIVITRHAPETGTPAPGQAPPGALQPPVAR